MLKIKNLHVKIKNKHILQGINLNIGNGETHVIMGPNGSGKSTLGNVLSGSCNYELLFGSVLMDGKNLLALEPSLRALLGLFLSFQYPVEIPGVSNAQFLRTAVNSIRKYYSKDDIDAMLFLKNLRKNLDLLKIDKRAINRGVNENFSGGEKKRNEILQLLMLKPSLCVLDEIDSGLDVDALKIVSSCINYMKSKKRSFILITHYQRLLNFIEPDFVHVLYNGKIIKSGDKSLAFILEEKGYEWITN
jgi:Fe-S cluster assembly ATP-binding protein